jgi:hypothetical protein
MPAWWNVEPAVAAVVELVPDKLQVNQPTFSLYLNYIFIFRGDDVTRACPHRKRGTSNHCWTARHDFPSLRLCCECLDRSMNAMDLVFAA